MNAHITGVGMTPFHESGRTIKELATDAIREALADASIELGDIQAVYFANSLAGRIFGQECIRGETVMLELGMRNVPLVNVENACASAGTALHLGTSAVRFGQYHTVLVVGVERMRVSDKSLTFAALSGATDVERPIELPSEGRGKRSPFIDVYAKRAARLMEQGVSRDSLARIASKAWSNGAMNPKAQRRETTTIERILASRMIVDPLTVDMCALVADGAAAAVLSTTRRQGDVTIRGSRLSTLSALDDDPSAAAAAAAAAYEESGLSPADVDIAEVHDATAPGEMLSWVGTLLCPSGDEEKWAQTGHTELGGPLPINPSGGLMARGHPIGASGLAQVYELIQQLRGAAGNRQVANARVALAHVGGGVLAGTKTAVSTVHLLSAD